MRIGLRIGFVGAGHIVKALARLAIANGHTVTLSNSRGPEALDEAAAEIGCQAAVVTDVPSSSDVVVLTVPFASAFAACTAVPSWQDRHRYEQLLPGSGWHYQCARPTPDDNVANDRKPFPRGDDHQGVNAILEKDLLGPGGLPNRAKCALPIAGDDAAAKVIVAILSDST
jgi:predicted dinucleotide-binding enzyme